MSERKCLICNKTFKVFESRIKIGKGKFCSKVCANKGAIGKTTWNKGLHGDFRLKGFPHSHTEKSKEKMSISQKIRFSKKAMWNKGTKGLMNIWNKGIKLPQFSNEGNPNWKGDEVGYSGLHRWVYRHRGKALKCEFCGKQKTTPRSIHWANKSHRYLRDLNDWISLCVGCHKKYDS